MKGFSTVVFLLLFVFNSSLVWGKKIAISWNDYVVFDLSENLPDSVRACAFANWISIEESKLYKTNNFLEHYGISSYDLLKHFRLEPSQTGMRTFVKRCIFYKETSAAFREKLQQYVAVITPSVRQTMQTHALGGMVVWGEVTSIVGTYNLVCFNPSNEMLSINITCSAQATWTTFSGEEIIRKKGKKKLFSHKPVRNVATLILQPKQNRKVQTLVLNDCIFYITPTNESFSTHRIEFNQPVAHAPFIDMFTVNQKQAVEKQKLTLSWSVLGTKEVELNQTIGTKNAKGQIMVSPTESCTYILEAKNRIGTVSDSVHVDVTRTVLSYVTANFMELANSEDKLASTEILIAIKNADGKILAQEKIGRGVSFDTKEDGQYGPFAVALNGTNYLRDAMSGTIEISINGDQPDTWQTIPVISLYFSDGNEMRLENLPQIKTSTTDSAVVLSY